MCVFLLQAGGAGVSASHPSVGGLGVCLLPVGENSQEEEGLLRNHAS